MSTPYERMVARMNDLAPMLINTLDTQYKVTFEVLGRDRDFGPNPVVQICVGKFQWMAALSWRGLMNEQSLDMPLLMLSAFGQAIHMRKTYEHLALTAPTSCYDSFIHTPPTKDEQR